MNRKMITGAAALCAILAISTFALAQHDDQKDKAKTQTTRTPTTRTTTVQKQAYGSAYHGGVRADGPTNGGVDYVGDGYYLFNRNHPGVQLALTITF